MISGYLKFNAQDKTDNQIAQIAETHFQLYPPKVLQRGNGAEQSFQEAMLAYVNKDFTLAKSLFVHLKKENAEINIYYANILMKEGNFYDAIQSLELPNAFYDVNQRHNAEWYLALCYLHVGEKDKARKMLYQIYDNESHLFNRKAKLLLDTLASQ